MYPFFLEIKTTLDDTTNGIIKNLTDDTNGNGLAKSLKTVADKLTGQVDVEISKTDYDAVGTAVTAINKIIDATLEAGGLTELDTSNLKTLKTAVENVGKTFTSISEIKEEAGNKYKVLAKDITKAKEAMTSLGKDLTEVSTFAQNSSNVSQN